MVGDLVDYATKRLYAADPAGYLTARARLYRIALREHEGKPSEDADDSGDDDQGDGTGRIVDLETFLTIEAQALRYAAAETVVRYFDAHACGDWPSAFMALAHRESAKKYRKRIRRRYVGTGAINSKGTVTDEVIASHLIGWRSPPKSVDAGEWDLALEGLRAFLRRFAEIFLEENEPNNAIKHGLAVAGGAAVTHIGVQGSPNSVTIGGRPSLDYPSFTKQSETDWEWALETQWVDRDECLQLVDVATFMLESMRDVGRRNFDPPDEVEPMEVFWPTELRPDSLRSEPDTQGLAAVAQRLAVVLTFDEDTLDIPDND